MKLELKHLAPYLPYGLKIDVGNYTEKNIELNINILSNYNIESIKPILKKMCNVRHMNAKLINTDGFKRWNEGANKEIGIYYYINEVRIEHLEKWLIDFLLENHFDIYGLIDKGLAYECFHENEVMRQGNGTTYSYCDDCGESI